MPRQTNPRKKLREVLFSIHPLSYRIRIKELDKESMNKKLFVQIVKQLRKIEDRRDFMAEEIKKLKNEILKIHPKIDDKVVSIKLKECLNVLKKLNKGNVVNEEQLITMMRFYSLLDEINEAVDKS